MKIERDQSKSIRPKTHKTIMRVQPRCPPPGTNLSYNPINSVKSETH